MSKTKPRNGQHEQDPPPIAASHTRQEVEDAQPSNRLPKEEKPMYRCLQCGGTLMEVTHTSTLHYQGYHPPKACPGDKTPQPYTSVVRQRVRCRSCRRVTLLVSRPFDPKAWRGPGPDPF